MTNSSSEIPCENEIKCFKPALQPCHHCSKHLCLEHINEHNDLNMVRVEELSDEMNILTDFISNLNTDKSLENARNKLNLWKQENQDRIERIYADHSDAIHRLESELNDRLNIFKGSLEPTISDSKAQLSYYKKINQATRQDLSLIESNLNQLYECLQSIQCEIIVETDDISFENYVRINKIFSYNRDLLDNSKIQSYRTLPVENMKKFVSSKNNQTILWLDDRRRLHFIDQDLQPYVLTLPELPSSAMLSDHQIRKIDDDIIDIKWCSFAGVFLVLFPRYLYSFNPNTRQFTLISLNRYKNYPFLCLTCLNEPLIFISYSIPGICIEQWKYSSNNECLKHWDNLTKDKNEWVCSMNTNSVLQIGLLIRRGETIYRRFELRDEKLKFLKTISLDYINAIFPFRSDHWFVKSSSGKYYVYSTETDECHLSRLDFPFGLDEFGINTIIIGSKQNELILCDI